MRIIVTGMFALTTTTFEIRQSTLPTWWELRTKIRTRLAQELPVGIFDRYYRCFQMFASFRGGVYERMTAQTQIHHESTVVIVPSTKMLFSRYDEMTGGDTNNDTRPRPGQVSSNVKFMNWSVRYESIKSTFGENHSQEKAVELANLGLHGVEKCGDAALVQCCHCYGIIMADTKSSVEIIRSKHLNEFPGCPLKDPAKAIKATWNTEANEPYYKQQMLSLANQLIEQRMFFSQQVNWLKEQMDSFKAKAREPTRDLKGDFKCLLCLSEKAVVIALPCLHLCLCANCYLTMKSHNEAGDVPLKCIYCNEEPRYFSRVFGDSDKSD